MPILLRNLEGAGRQPGRWEGLPDTCAGGLLQMGLQLCGGECWGEAVLWGPSHFICPLQCLRSLGQLSGFPREQPLAPSMASGTTGEVSVMEKDTAVVWTEGQGTEM